MSEQRQPIAVIQNTGVGLKLTDFNDVQRLAAYVFASGLVPKTLDSPEKIGIALLHGMEIGLPPMMSLQRIAVINGMPTVFGDAALAIVEASGKLLFIREFIEGGRLEDPNTHAVCELQRKGKPEPIRRTYSIGDANRAGLLNKGGPWKSNPARMLQMRARGFALRDTFADVLGGLYLHEEIEGESIDAPRAPPKDITPSRDPDKQIGIEEVVGTPGPVEPPPAPTVYEAEIDQEIRDSLPPVEEISDRFMELLEQLDDYSDSEQHLQEWRKIMETEKVSLTGEEWHSLIKSWSRKMAKIRGPFE